MRLTDYINSRSVVFLEEDHKDRIIGRLIEKIASLSLIRDISGFETAVRQRETLSSTGIGMGLAIPHGRCPEATDFFIIPGISRNPVEWRAIDDSPVKAIFLIGIPDLPAGSGKNITSRYLEIIAALMLMVKNPARREALFSAETPDAVMAALSDPTRSFTAA